MKYIFFYCAFSVFSVFSVFSQSAAVAKQAPLNVKVIAGDPVNGAMSNSILITGKDHAFLIDTQQTVNNANRVVEKIRETHKILSTVFFTHAHSDHILGAAVIKQAFPNATFITTPEVALEIQKNGEHLRQLFTKILADSKVQDTIADSIVVPTPIQSTSALDFEGNKIRIIEVKSGESESSAMLYVPKYGTLFSGDVLYHDVHLWLRDGKFEDWIKNLKMVKGIPGLKTIYPGHGSRSGPELVDRNLEYIDHYVKIVSSSASVKDAVEKMKETYPRYKMERILSLGVEKNFPVMHPVM